MTNYEATKSDDVKLNIYKGGKIGQNSKTNENESNYHRAINYQQQIENNGWSQKILYINTYKNQENVFKSNMITYNRLNRLRKLKNRRKNRRRKRKNLGASLDPSVTSYDPQ